MSQNYTIGQGKMYFAEFSTGEVPAKFRYLGNTPEFALTSESETLDHISSEGGVPEVDDSANLSVTRTGTFVTDDIDKDNLALFFFGASSSVSIAAANSQVVGIDQALPGAVHFLGITDADRVGYRNIKNVALLHGTDIGDGGMFTGSTRALARTARDTAHPTPSSGDAVLLRFGTAAGGYDYRYSEYNGSAWVDSTADLTPLTEGADYELDADNGRVSFMLSSTVVAAGLDDVQVAFDVGAASYERVLSGSAPIQGQLRFTEDNPKGDNRTWVLPKVTLRPNGDIALKGTEWRQIPFAITVEKPSTGAAIYIDGVPQP